MINCILCNTILIKRFKDIYLCDYCNKNNYHVSYLLIPNMLCITPLRRINKFEIRITLTLDLYLTKIIVNSDVVKKYNKILSKEEILNCFENKEKYFKLYNVS